MICYFVLFHYYVFPWFFSQCGFFVSAEAATRAVDAHAGAEKRARRATRATRRARARSADAGRLSSPQAGGKRPHRHNRRTADRMPPIGKGRRKPPAGALPARARSCESREAGSAMAPA